MPPDANMVKFGLFYPHLGRGPCFVYLAKNLEWFTVKPSTCSCPLRSMDFISKLQIYQCWMNMFTSLQKGWRGAKDCMQQASPQHFYPHSDCKLQWWKDHWRCLTRSKFPFFLISGRKHLIAWWACPIPAGAGAGWCMWTQLQLEHWWLTALVVICKECSAAGAVLWSTERDQPTGDQPLDATEARKRRRVKGDLWLKFRLLMLFTNLYPSATLLINDCSWNAMCQQWITYFCCTSVVYG